MITTMARAVRRASLPRIRTELPMNFPLVPLAILGLAAASFAFVTEPAPRAPMLEDSVRYVTVTITGTAMVPPSYLSMGATLSSTADVGEQCVQDFAQARTRAMGGLGSAGLPGGEVLGSGVEFSYGPPAPENNNGYFISNYNAEQSEEGVTCKEKLEVRFLPEGDSAAQHSQVALAIDVAVELGLKLDSNVSNPYNGFQGNQNNTTGTIAGKLTDEGRRAAYGAAQANAMEEARIEASHLASLSSGQLGGVISVNQTNRNVRWKGLNAGVEATCTLTVRFELN